MVPLAVAEARTSGEIAADPVTAVALVRGVTPLLAVIASLALLRPRLRPRSYLELPAVAYVAVAATSALWSVEPRATVLKAGVLGLSYLLVIVLYRAWRSVAEALSDVAVVTHLLVLSALGGAIFAIGSAFRDSPARLYAVLPEIHPVPLGTIALVSFVFVLSGSGPPWLRHPVVRSMLGAAALTVLGLSLTRTAILMAPVAILVYVIARRRLRLAAVLVGGSAVALALALSVPSTRQLVGDAIARGGTSQQLTTLGNRLPMWEVALDVWDERPVLGHGYYAGHRYGPYPRALAAYTASQGGPPEFVEERSDLAFIDGAYVETLVDVGILGLVPLGLFVVAGSASVIQMARRSPALGAPVAASVVVLAVDSVLSYSLQTPSYQGHLLAALLLASTLPWGSRAQRQPPASRS